MIEMKLDFKHPISPYVEVFLNEKKVSFVINADEEKGEVLAYVMDGKNVVIAKNGQEAEKTILRGNVVVDLRHEAPEWARAMLDGLRSSA
jgi:hypothetical protein